MTVTVAASSQGRGLLPVPRVVGMITVKRNAPVFGRSYGHWWLEVDSVESYGWWPAKPPSLAELVRGTAGVLNGPGDPAAAGLVDGTGNYRTRGSGCPALAPLRRLTGRFTGKRRWPRNLPRPGQRLATIDPAWCSSREAERSILDGSHPAQPRCRALCCYHV